MDSIIQTLSKNPEKFLVPSSKIKKDCFNIAKHAFDSGNSKTCYGTLSKLLGEEDGFSQLEQIWELLQLRNSAVLSYSNKTLQDTHKYDKLFNQDEEESDISDEESENDSNINSDVEQDELSEIDEELQQESEHDSDLDQDIEMDSEDQNDDDLDLEDSDQHGELDLEDNPKEKATEVDDEFFSLGEMHKFAEEAEQIEMRDRQILAGEGDPLEQESKSAFHENDEDESESESDDDFDLFADPDEMGDSSDDDMDPSKIMYDDFFKPPKTSKRSAAKESRELHAKRVKFDPKSYSKETEDNNGENDESEHEENSSDEGDSQEQDTNNTKMDLLGSDDEQVKDNRSTFEKYQEKMREQIEKLEEEAVSKKEWTMTGEIGSRLRPIDSLLGEHLDYDYVQKPVPVITKEVTESLEEMIKRKIIAAEFDDVVRKKLDTDDSYRKSSKIELDDTAPKKSLAEVYEQEYMSIREEGLSGQPKSMYTDTELQLHKEISDLHKSLNYKLDSLTNFYYTPKMSVPDVEIRVDAPAIQMEESLPIQVSNANQLAPEEIFSGVTGKKGNPKKSSLTQTDTKLDNNAEDSETIFFGRGTGDIKGASEATDADRRRWRSVKKKALKQKNKDIAKSKAETLPKTTKKPLVNNKA
ncbi:hypothetical protein BB558_001274 [Smittium angustum]|uniref:U3 small nucleolar ribonucleoprotein protein MPP10 n=1 Tax=Smittium angustum TaxID=133377 RepID=A0A2U1JC41_SMIAN|nr:hypothetical protein BB558_001274 [Smittium angustum]